MVQPAPITSSTSPGGTTSVTGSSTLGTDAFLQLLMTQLRYQDPLSPMDSTQFTAQLAQFSTLEQLTTVNSTLNNLLLTQMSATNLAATNLLGKTIKAAGDSVSVKAGSSSPISYTLAQDAASVVLQIYDANGALVKTMTKGAQPAGDQQVIWDATDDQGRTVADGTYKVKVTATNSKAESVGVTLYQTGTVTGVTYQNGIPYLLLGQQKVQMGQLIEVLGT